MVTIITFHCISCLVIHTIDQTNIDISNYIKLFLIITGTNGDGRNFISNINLTYPEQVLLKCNNILSENKNKVSWKKVQFNQSVVSLDVKTDSFNDSVPSLSGTGKFICYNNDTVFHITYVYPQGML